MKKETVNRYLLTILLCFILVFLMPTLPVHAEENEEPEMEMGPNEVIAYVLETGDKEVLNMQLVLIPVLAEAWKKTYSELSDLLKKYDVLSYIDVCYENYNSTGNQGIIDDLQDYIEMQGGRVS